MFFRLTWREGLARAVRARTGKGPNPTWMQTLKDCSSLCAAAGDHDCLHMLSATLSQTCGLSLVWLGHCQRMNAFERFANANRTDPGTSPTPPTLQTGTRLLRRKLEAPSARPESRDLGAEGAVSEVTKQGVCARFFGFGRHGRWAEFAWVLQSTLQPRSQTLGQKHFFGYEEW